MSATAIHGSKARAYVTSSGTPFVDKVIGWADTDISSYTESVDWTEAIVMHDNTTLGETALTRQPGLADNGDISLVVNFNTGLYSIVTTSGAGWLALTQAGTPLRFTFLPGGLVAGQPYMYINCWLKTVPRAASATDIQKETVVLQATGAVTRGTLSAGP